MPRKRSAPRKGAATAGTPLDRSLLARAFEVARATIVGDPLLRPPFHRSFSIDELSGYLARPGRTFEELFGTTLQGMSQAYRYAALHVLEAMFRDDARGTTTLDDVEVAQGERRFLRGDVHVRGRVVNRSILVVEGNLRVDGNYYGGWAYSLLAVTGKLRIGGNVSTSGEILVRGAMQSKGIVHTRGNDYSCVISELRARALVQEDRNDVLGRYEGPRYRDVTTKALRELFGDAADVEQQDEDDNPLLRLLGV